MRGNRQSPLRHQRGFALLIMLVIVMMGVLYLAVNGANVVSMKLGRSDATNAALLRAKEALIGYAATYRDNTTHASEVFGYLPCPDMTAAPTVGPPPQGNGVADNNCNAAGDTVAGLLPYRTLGLEDIRDSDGICLWYVVSGTFKNSPNFQPLNWDTQGEIQVVDSAGNAVVSPNDTSGGAAAVIVAAGPPLPGQNRTPNPNNVCGAMPDEIAAYLESAIDATGTTVLTQGDARDAGGNLIKNDRLQVVTPKEIFDRIASRNDFKNILAASPSGLINNLTDRIRIAIETQMQSQLDASTAAPIAPTGAALPANQVAYTQFAGKQIGEVTNLILGAASDANWFTNWKNQYRQVACTDISSPCLSIATTQCRGALLFGGRSGTAGPRASSTMVPSTANLDALFEAGQGREILTLADMSFAGQTTYSAPHALVARDPTTYSDPYNLDADRALDVGTCLFPGTFLSFNNGIGSFIAKSSLAINAPVAIDTAAKTITLGNTAASGFNSGCAWSPPLPFATSLRAYFTFNILDRGEGFVFAVADADPMRNSPSGFLCGDGGAAMGYAGSGLNYPKMGLEIDTRRELGYDDPLSDHVAFVYWGTAASATDDNVHGVPAATAIDGTQPLNPRGLGTLSVSGASWAANVATITTTRTHYLLPNQLVTIAGINPSGFNGTHRVIPTGAMTFTFSLNTNPGSYLSGGTASSPFHGIATVASGDTTLLPPSSGRLPLNTDIHVRVDITRSHNGASGTYHLAAYVVSAPEPEGIDGSCVTLSNLRNLSFDMESLACAHGPTVSQDGIVIDDIPGFAAALSSVYAGFTNGQRGTTVAGSAAGEQDITISNFLMRVQ